MSASTVIGDVTQTLQELLEDEQQPTGLFNVSLDFPAEQTTDSSPTVNLYLFRVAEDDYAKNREWISTGTGRLEKPPLALNLFYILTPFVDDRLDEHRVLGEVMRILYDYSIIEGPLLRGGLEHTNEQIKIDLCQFTIEELTRIWNAFNSAYRLSVCYQARVILIDSTIERPISRVIEKENQYSLIHTS